MESIPGPEKLARYSFIGFDPRITIKAEGDEVEMKDHVKGEKERRKVKDPLMVIRGLQQGRWVDDGGPRLVGGAVGYVSYEAVRYWERVLRSPKEEGFPTLEMGVFDDGIVFDHIHGRAFYYYRDVDRTKEIEEALHDGEVFEGLSYTEPRVDMSPEAFRERVLRMKEYILAGDIFQAVLSKRYEFLIEGDLIHFYQSLRDINPSPYMYFFKIGERCVVGSSPEMLVRVDGRTVETFPIAGTRPRLEDSKANAALRKELLMDSKECAEHVMLVDLARNDLGRVSEFGSVHVPELMEVHEFSHVQHIVSRVVGRLRRGLDAFDTFRSVFPAGTVTGAPKVRAMEIIDELEPSPRGPYAGALGYFSYNGNADFAITIRSLVSNGKKAYVQAGAGIVADSNPEREWAETEYKAAALMKALEEARQMKG